MHAFYVQDNMDWHWWRLGPFVGAVIGSIFTLVIQGIYRWSVRPVLTIDQHAKGLVVPAAELDAQRRISVNCYYARLFV